MKNLLFTFLIVFFLVNSLSAQWITYTESDSSYQLQFPGQPQVMNLNVGYGIDSTKIIQYSQIDSTDSYVFILTVQSLSGEILKPEYDGQKRYEVLKIYGTAGIGLIGKIVHTENIFLDGYPGVFAEGEITQAVNQPPYPPVFVKAFLVGNKIYSLTVTCSVENKENPVIDKFFNSFELIKNK